MTCLSPERFLGYLAAKKVVDDRSINKGVWNTLRESVATLEKDGPLMILESGCGIGTMVERIIDWELAPHILYTGVDASGECITEARRRLSLLASRPGTVLVEDKGGRLTIQRQKASLTADLVVMELSDYLASIAPGSVDLSMAHAFLDLVDINTLVPLLLSRVRPGGLITFTLNFDGLTAFEPAVDRDLDEEIIRLYHETMDKRTVKGQPTGGSRTGRSLLRTLKEQGLRILDVGSSDWICLAGEEGYGRDEALFLHFIVDTIGEALTGHPLLNGNGFLRWLELRHRQIESGLLIFIAHQLDVVGQVVRSPESMR